MLRSEVLAKGSEVLSPWLFWFFSLVGPATRRGRGRAQPSTLGARRLPNFSRCVFLKARRTAAPSSSRHAAPQRSAPRARTRHQQHRLRHTHGLLYNRPKDTNTSHPYRKDCTASSARASTSPLPSQPPTRPGTARFLHLSSAACAPLLQEPSAPSTARLLSGGPPYGQQELDHHRWRKDASARPSGRATLFFICHIINTLCDTITDTWVRLLAISPRPLSMK